MTEYSRKLIVIAKNGTKQRMHEATVKVKQICENLKRRTKDEYFAVIDHTRNNSQKRRATLSINLEY